MLPLTPDVAGESELFGMRDSMTIAAVRTVGIGALQLTNVCALLGRPAQPAIGLDVLAALTPTFAAAARTLTLRRRFAARTGESLPMLLGFPGVRFVPRAGQSPVAMESAAGRSALRGTRWTFDVKRGALETER